MELWEYNEYIRGFTESRKYAMSDNIMTGFYCAYFTNGGKKAKKPNDLINKLFAKTQSFHEGLQAIERLKEFEQKKE